MDESHTPNLGLEDLRWLQRLARRLVRDPEDAEDAVQDTVLAALTRAPSSVDAPRGWLARVLYNVVRQRRRGAVRRVAREREGGVPEQARSTVEIVEELAWHRTLVDQVNALAEPYRSTIVLRFLRSRSPREIASEQGIPVKTVHTRVERGLAHLRDALDRAHGDDRAAWVPAIAALGASSGSGTVTGTLVLGGMAMGTMVKVSGAVLVAAACLYFGTRAPHAEAPRMAAAEPRETSVELGVAADLPEVESGAAGQRSSVPDTPSAGESVTPGTNVLRVVLEGIAPESVRETRVRLLAVDAGREWPTEIRDSWSCESLTSEFDLDPFLARVAERDGDVDLDSAELEVEIDHPLHLPERIRIPLSGGVDLASGQRVYEIRVHLVPAGVVHGQLVRENGDPAAEGLVGGLLLEETTWERPTTNGSTLTDVPVEGEGLAVECAEDGSFEWRVPVSGRYALASYEEGRRPTTTRVDVLVGKRIDVGTLVVEPGHGITGHALRHGNPMTGASLSLTQPRVFWAADPADVEQGMNPWVQNWRILATDVRSVTLLWLESQFELAGQRVEAGDNGAFAFGGLAPREHRLRVAELAGSRFLPGSWDNPAFGVEGPDEMVVRAPAQGVVLEFSWTSIRFELEGDIDDEDAGRLVLRTKSLYPGNEHMFVPEYWSTQFPLSGDERNFVLQAPSTRQLQGEISFPGRQPVHLDFQTPEPGGEVVIPVDLVQSEEAATLLIELENPRAEIPEVFTVMLSRTGQEATPDLRPVEVLEGQLRVDDIVPGQYRVRVYAAEDPNHAGLFFKNEFELELHPGLVTKQSIQMQSGAGLRVTLRDENGALLSGQYEFYDHAGNRVTLCLVVIGRWEPGSDRWATHADIHPYEVNQSSSPIDPGRYRLVLISPGYAKRSVMVELRAGEYEEVDVSLTR